MSEVRRPQHKISVVVDNERFRDWETYEFTVDLTNPVGAFSLRAPFLRRIWDLCREDRPIWVMIDDVIILTGFIGERLNPENDPDHITILGHNRVRRLVKESAPGINFAGLTMKALIEKLASPFFDEVTFSNARNRNIIRGRGRKSKAGNEPLKLFTEKRIGTRIQPGQARWQVIATLLAQAGLIAWSSGDGREFIVGKPHYDQEPQFRFFHPAPDSRRVAESTVLGMGVRHTIEDRYSRVDCVGTSVGTEVSYGKNVQARFASVRNNPATRDGEGLDFSEPARLIIMRTPRDQAQALELAQREMDRRDAGGTTITVSAAGHGQIVSGSTFPTIFAPDTIASVEHERTGTQGLYLIRSCTYRSSRDQAETTTMELIKSGSELSIS